MNAARLEKSERLQRTLEVLMDGKPHTTLDIAVRTRSCATHSNIAELRENGVGVSCRCAGTSAQGGRVYVYQLERFTVGA